MCEILEPRADSRFSSSSNDNSSSFRRPTLPAPRPPRPGRRHARGAAIPSTMFCMFWWLLRRHSPVALGVSGILEDSCLVSIPCRVGGVVGFLKTASTKVCF